MKSGAPWEHTLAPSIVSRGPDPFKRYVFWFLIVTVIAYIAGFPLVRSPQYTKWKGSQWGPMLDFAYAPGKASADVVIFGDSSAFVGVDPRILEAQLGVRALLLPNTVGSLPITGDIPLQRYFTTHAPPRLLVFYFSPWNLDYMHATKVRFFEGEEMLLRHGTAREIASFASQHPAELLFFPFRFYNAYGRGIARSVLGHPQKEISTAPALGHMDDRDPFPPLDSSCKLPAKLLEDESSASVEALAHKYMGRVAVLVYMAPIPGCKNAAEALQRSLGNLDAMPPAVLPASDFLGDPYYAHIEPGAVPVASQLLAEAVKRRLAAPATGSQIGVPTRP